MKIEGAIVFVTGTNRGLGLQLVKALKTMGAAKIYAASRTGELTEEGTIPVKLDITHPDEIAAAAALAQVTTLLINNAGINHAAPLLNPLQDELGTARNGSQLLWTARHVSRFCAYSGSKRRRCAG